MLISLLVQSFIDHLAKVSNWGHAGPQMEQKISLRKKIYVLGREKLSNACNYRSTSLITKTFNLDYSIPVIHNLKWQLINCWYTDLSYWYLHIVLKWY